MGFVADQNVVVSDCPTPCLSEEVSVEGLSPGHTEVERLASVAAFVVAVPVLCFCSSPRARECHLGAQGLDTEVPHAHKKDSSGQPAHDRLAFMGDHDPLVVAACLGVQWEQEIVVVEEGETGPRLD